MIVDVMTKPEATVRTGMFIRSLGYIVLEVSDLERWAAFAIGVLGLETLPGPTSETRLLKMDTQAYRIMLMRGPADDLLVAGWDVPDSTTLDAYARYLDGLGVAYEWVDGPLLALRAVDRMLRLRDPNGVWHEMFVGVAQGDAFEPHITRGGFVTGAGGLGHIVFGSADYAGSLAFAQRVLGASVSDIIQQELAPGVKAHVTFMHVNERHHSIAYAGRAGGKKLHHVMVEVEKIADVGLARDRHVKFGLGISQDIGQHPNDQMISYYGTTPSGFFVEYGWGGVKVDVKTWQPGSYDRMSDWGHRPLVPAKPNPTTSDVAKKEKPMSATGNWKLLITTPMGEQPGELTVTDDLTGKMTAMGETVAVQDGTLDGDQLNFKADVTRPFPMTLTFSLHVAGDKLAGQVLAGPLGNVPVTATRA